jgi:hypothetical protein
MSASARKVKISVMAERGGCASPKRNKRAAQQPFSRVGDCVVAHWRLSLIVCKAAIMQKLLAVAFIGALCTVPALAATGPASTQILQQRTADGRLLLTDRPAPGAKTERSWQVEREDPAAARQRAIDVKAEANLVSERVQRMLDQQRRADDDAMRMRMAMVERDRMSPLDAADGGVYAYGGGAGWLPPFRGSRSIGPRIGQPPLTDPIAPPGTNRPPGGRGNTIGSGSRGSHSRW